MAGENTHRDSEQRGSLVLLRYSIVILMLSVIVIGIIVRTLRTAFVENAEWVKISETQKRSDRLVYPSRGNIYANDGRLMATSVPRYYTYIDFKADGFDEKIFRDSVDLLSQQLAKRIGWKTAAEYKLHLLKGLTSKSRQYEVVGPKVSYAQLKDMRTFCYLRMINMNKSGFYVREMVERQRPFGSLASRTIGDVFGEIEKEGFTKGRNGLEMQYDSLLRGVPGLNAVRRINGVWTNIIEIEPIDGMDVRTTIDIDIQDVTERSLIDMLTSTDAESGTAMVMEVSTGEIKAITNMGRIRTGVYGEIKNLAVADLLEPGSTFKTASIMVALEDGVCHPHDTVDTGNGIFHYGRAIMRDHNWHRGGYKKITVEEAMWNSSNIGVAKTILKGYKDTPEKFVKGLYRLGLTEDLKIEIPGAATPIIRMPNKDHSNWSNTALPWMSFGYETQIPPIYTLTFYNAIANNGKMVRPMFTKEILKNGATVRSFSTQVVKSSICSSHTLQIIRNMLEGVVEHGTGKPVHSDIIKIAGKTGTAQIAEGGRYDNGHQVSFVGYFPADKPEYTCMVLIRRPRIGAPSGGLMSGAVVKGIAEKIIASRLRYDIREVEPDSARAVSPMPKAGEKDAMRYVLRKLDVETDTDGSTSPWVLARANEDRVEVKDIKMQHGLVPRVVGMGAKDAIYLLESAGLHVNMSGMGRVVRQSIEHGARVVKGQTITITLR